MTRIALAGLLVAVAAVPAAADPIAATVKVSSADLSSSAARARLDRRIGNAIEQVCGSYASIEPDQWPSMDECWRSAREQADSRLASIRADATVRIGSR